MSRETKVSKQQRTQRVRCNHGIGHKSQTGVERDADQHTRANAKPDVEHLPLDNARRFSQVLKITAVDVTQVNATTYVAVKYGAHRCDERRYIEIPERHP